ncbi:hypothetical protein D3C72_1010040 [compost metagenome]
MGAFLLIGPGQVATVNSDREETPIVRLLRETEMTNTSLTHGCAKPAGPAEHVERSLA